MIEETNLPRMFYFDSQLRPFVEGVLTLQENETCIDVLVYVLVCSAIVIVYYYCIVLVMHNYTSEKCEWTNSTFHSGSKSA